VPKAAIFDLIFKSQSKIALACSQKMVYGKCVRPTNAGDCAEFSDRSRRLCLGSWLDRLWWSLEIQRPGVAASNPFDLMHNRQPKRERSGACRLV
jgi:hypothetical protein